AKSACEATETASKAACFTEGTQVVVGMGYDENGNVLYDTKNIEDIQVGDLVYCYDTATGSYEYKAVTDTFARVADHINYLTIEDESGNIQTIETTDGHPFWVVTDEPDLERAARSVVDENGDILYHENIAPGLNGFWVEAKDLREGDVFLGSDGKLSTLTGTTRVEQDGGIAVFNFTVEGNSNYFVLEKDFELGQTCVLVHNATPLCTSQLTGRQLKSEMSGNKIKSIAKDMRINGYNKDFPIQVAKVDDYIVIIDGHHRAAAATRAGIRQVPVEFVKVSPEFAKTLLKQIFETMR
ncbi:MAG: polymorphic toxin-type HINT domain-containing protein, partial [Thermoguttaceae bacterium]